jgi:hypothetical protein
MMLTRADRDKDPALDEQCRAIENAAAVHFIMTGKLTPVTPRLMLQCLSLGMDTRCLDAGVGGKTI